MNDLITILSLYLIIMTTCKCEYIKDLIKEIQSQFPNISNSFINSILIPSFYESNFKQGGDSSLENWKSVKWNSIPYDSSLGFNQKEWNQGIQNALISFKYHHLVGLQKNTDTFECDLYSSLESHSIHCGPNGYLLGYGQRYCQLFTLNAEYFSTKGQDWVRDCRLCLANKISSLSSNDSYNTCTSIKAYGIQSHASCYVESGFCDLPFHDLIQIVKIVGWKHLLDKDGVGQGIQTIHGCVDRLKSIRTSRLFLP